MAIFFLMGLLIFGGIFVCVCFGFEFLFLGFRGSGVLIGLVRFFAEFLQKGMIVELKISFFEKRLIS